MNVCPAPQVPGGPSLQMLRQHFTKNGQFSVNVPGQSVQPATVSQSGCKEMRENLELDSSNAVTVSLQPTFRLEPSAHLIKNSLIASLALTKILTNSNLKGRHAMYHLHW